MTGKLTRVLGRGSYMVKVINEEGEIVDILWPAATIDHARWMLREEYPGAKEDFGE